MLDKQIQDTEIQDTLLDTRVERIQVSLSGGERVWLRPIEADDAPALQRLHGRLGERTVLFRFFGPKHELTEEQARDMADLDALDRFALVAESPEAEGEVVGVVRYDRTPNSNQAEYAALVEDHWQGCGLGPEMTRRLVSVARDRGIKVFQALVRPDNRHMLDLLRALGLPEHVHREEGIESIEIEL